MPVTVSESGAASANRGAFPPIPEGRKRNRSITPKASVFALVRRPTNTFERAHRRKQKMCKAGKSLLHQGVGCCTPGRHDTRCQIYRQLQMPWPKWLRVAAPRLIPIDAQRRGTAPVFWYPPLPPRRLDQVGAALSAAQRNSRPAACHDGNSRRSFARRTPNTLDGSGRCGARRSGINEEPARAENRRADLIPPTRTRCQQRHECEARAVTAVIARLPRNPWIPAFAGMTSSEPNFARASTSCRPNRSFGSR